MSKKRKTKGDEPVTPEFIRSCSWKLEKPLPEPMTREQWVEQWEADYQTFYLGFAALQKTNRQLSAGIHAMILHEDNGVEMYTAFMDDLIDFKKRVESLHEVLETMVARYLVAGHQADDKAA